MSELNDLDYFTVVGSVTWSLNGSEAAGNHTDFTAFCCINQVVRILTTVVDI